MGTLCIVGCVRAAMTAYERYLYSKNYPYHDYRREASKCAKSVGNQTTRQTGWSGLDLHMVTDEHARPHGPVVSINGRVM